MLVQNNTTQTTQKIKWLTKKHMSVGIFQTNLVIHSENHFTVRNVITQIIQSYFQSPSIRAIGYSVNETVKTNLS